MHRIVFALVACSLAFSLAALPARADGGLFPVNVSAPYPVVRYHHVTVEIDGNHALTRVDQAFFNPYPYAVQTRYLFPVPPGSRASAFQFKVDGQLQQAVRQDAVASRAALYPLVVNRREPSLLQYAGWETVGFDLSLPPLGARHMLLQYEETLPSVGALFRYRYVLGTERYSAQPVGEITLAAHLRSPAGLSNVYSPSHSLLIQARPGQTDVSWRGTDVSQPEDFELFFGVPASGFGAGLLTARRAGADHFMFLFSPGDEPRSSAPMPKDIVFVLDHSGSMAGDKIDQARAAVRYFLQRLGKDDRFALVSFNQEHTTLAAELQPADDRTLTAARGFVDNLTATGNTDLAGALSEALAVFERSERRETAARMILFLTDGQPTAGPLNPEAIAGEVRGRNARVGARLHVFGVGYDVNSFLLDQVASDNGGSVTYVQPGENLEGALTSFYDGVSRPVLTGLQVEFEGMTVSDLYPRQLPDIFTGSSLLLSGRYRPQGEAVSVRVRGRAGEEVRTFTYRFNLADVGGHDFVAPLWATRRVGDLLDQVRVKGESPSLVAELCDLGLDYGIVTPYTNFVIAAQADGAASLQNMALYGSSALNRASGQVTIQARVQNQAYQGARQANLAQGANVLNLRQYSVAQLVQAPQANVVAAPGTNGASSLLNLDLSVLRGRNLTGPVTVDWVLKNVAVDRHVIFGSDEYLRLAEDAEIRPMLQSGTNVIFAHDGQVYQVQDGPGTAAPAGQGSASSVDSEAQKVTSPLLDLLRALERLVAPGHGSGR